MHNYIEDAFQSLSEKIDFPVDQVRYIVLMFLSYPLALVLRHALHPNHTSTLVRHVYSLSLGLLMGFICFGWQEMAVLFFIIIVSYCLLFLPPTVTQRYSMVWAMGSITAAHLYRMVTDYGGWHLDFTGPLMVLVQKITLVGFALHDGKGRASSELNSDQRENKLESIPTPLEYFCYMFNFHSFLAGPSCTMKEFLAFMDGSNLRPTDQRQSEPSSFYPVVSKLFYSLINLFLFITLTGYIDSNLVLDPQYKHPFRLFLNYVNSFRIRNRYYFIWLLSESINHCAGLGFSGYDKDGKASWDLIRNLYIMEIEFATSVRSILHGWNSMTSKWLRRCVYERSPIAPTLVTFTLSAWWHGFYPGYYCCFVYFGVVTIASRKMRHLVRHHFQGSAGLRIGYDVLTWFLSHIWLDFGVLCLDLLWMEKCITYWSYYYYIPLIIVCVIAILPFGGKKRPTKGEGKGTGEGTVLAGEGKGTGEGATKTKTE